MYKKIFAGLAVFIALSGAALAQTAVTETYLSDGPIGSGTVVSLREGETEYVEIATQESKNRMFGVVVQQTDSNIRLQEEGRALFVTTFGKVQTFVTDVNGPIRAGDTLTISPIQGVAMKSNEEEPTIGVALSDFKASEETLTTKEVNDAEGETRVANIGMVAVQVNPKQGNNSLVPSFLASFGESVAGKPVTSFRLFTALAVMVVTLASSSVLLFGAIRSAIIAIGRNPLSKALVYRGLFQVLAIVIVIFASGIIGAYVILKV